jgi:hypothetical protein
VAARVREDGRIQVSIRQELGLQDLTIARSRANPSAEECRALLHRLRQRRAELAAACRELEGEAQAQLAAAAPERFATLEYLRSADAELARTDDALDRLYDLLRPGADREADRRTRAAALAIGQERLEAVRRQLARAGAEQVADRLHVVPATLSVSEKDSGGRVVVTLLVPGRGGGVFPLNLLNGLFQSALGLVL